MPVDGYIQCSPGCSLELNAGTLLRLQQAPGCWSGKNLGVGMSFRGWVLLPPRATEGTRALIVTGFRDWRHDKICARTLVGHAASRRVMEKSGLLFEREFVYGTDIIPGWTEEERRAVKYSLSRT